MPSVLRHLKKFNLLKNFVGLRLNKQNINHGQAVVGFAGDRKSG